MKNKILFNHPVLGDITFADVISDLKIIIDDNKNLENIVYYILKGTEMTDEDIASLFNYSVIDRLEWLLFLLENTFESDEK